MRTVEKARGSGGLSRRGFYSLLAVGFICVAGVLLYANTIHNKMFWDDNDGILNNQYVHDWRYFPRFFSENLIAGSNLVSNYWRPALLTVFAAEWHLWGPQVEGYHAVNAAFHTADAALLFLFLADLPASIPVAALAAATFLVHPAQTEAVAYVSGLGDPLSAFFLLAALICYMRARRRGTLWRSWHYYAALALYCLALMSKETAIVLPALVALIEILFPDEGKGWKPRLKSAAAASWPFFSVAAAYVGLRATVLNFADTFNLYGRATPFTEHFSYRLFTFLESLPIYAKILIFPYPLHAERTIPVAVSFFSPLVMGGALIVLALAAAALFSFRRHPIIAFGLLWSAVVFSPTSNLLVPINALIYEHWLYLPLAGLVLALFEAGRLFLSRFPKFALPAAAFLSVTLVSFSALTVIRNHDWRNPIAFYTQTLRYSAPDYRILNNLGMAYADAGDPSLAMPLYEKALALDPKNPVAYHNLGNAYLEEGDAASAVRNFDAAISLDPKFIFSYDALANLYLSDGDYAGARQILLKLLPNAGDKPGVLAALASVAEAQGDAESAADYLNQALALDPGNREAAAMLKRIPAQ